jgi:hypothetical protein
MNVRYQSLTQFFVEMSSAKETNGHLSMGWNYIPGSAIAEALRLADWAGLAFAMQAPSARRASAVGTGLAPWYGG